MYVSSSDPLCPVCSIMHNSGGFHLVQTNNIRFGNLVSILLLMVTVMVTIALYFLVSIVSCGCVAFACDNMHTQHTERPENTHGSHDLYTYAWSVASKFEPLHGQ